MLLLLVIVLIIVAFGGLPTWGYHQYGYWPSGILGILLVVLVILVLMGRL
jgi:hypothetical protein